MSPQKTAIKSKEKSSSLVKKFFRYLSLPIVDKLKDTSITPNMVTYLSILLGIISSVLYAISGRVYLIIASVVLFFSVELDYVDGSLARTKGISTNFGYWIDKIGDMFILIFLFFGITLGVFNQRNNYLVWLYGFLSITAVFMVRYMYVSLQYKLKTAEQVFETEKKKHKIIREFFFNEHFILSTMMLAGLLNLMYYYLIFCAVYGWIFVSVMFFILSRKLHKEH